MRDSMSPKWFALTSVVVFVYLIVVNAFVFPFVFPDGLAEKFANARAENIPLFHLLAFATTAILLTALVSKISAARRSKFGGVIGGILLGLLVALPEHLHLYAMVEETAIKQFVPVVWIIFTWGLAGLIVDWIRDRGDPSKS